MKNITMLSVACAAMIFASCGSDTKTDKKTVAPAPVEKQAEPVAPATTNTIDLTGDDNMKYNATNFTVSVGETITLNMKNIGTLPATAMSHDVIILKPGSSVADFGNAVAMAKDFKVANLPDDKKAWIIAETKMLGPGEADKITFTLSEEGEYPFLCSFPGHYGTMQGNIKAVKPAI